jgi:hypothetical protein
MQCLPQGSILEHSTATLTAATSVSAVRMLLLGQCCARTNGDGGRLLCSTSCGMDVHVATQWLSSAASERTLV